MSFRTTSPRLKTTKIFRIGDSEACASFYASLGDRYLWSDAIVPEACELFEVSEDDVKCIDVFWGGEYSDDRSVEVITACGVIVASIDEPITAEDVAAINANAFNFPRIR